MQFTVLSKKWLEKQVAWSKSWKHQHLIPAWLVVEMIGLLWLARACCCSFMILLYSSENRTTPKQADWKKCSGQQKQETSLIHVNGKRPRSVFLTYSLVLTADFKKHSSVVWQRALLQISLMHVLESMKTWTCGKLIRTGQRLLLCSDKVRTIWKVGFKYLEAQSTCSLMTSSFQLGVQKDQVLGNLW